FEEIGNIKEGVTFQSDVHEGGLHPRQHLGHPPLVDIAYYGFRALPLNHELNEFIVLQDGEFGFLGRGGNDQFFVHRNSSTRARRAQTRPQTVASDVKSSRIVMELLCPRGASFAQLRASALTGNRKIKKLGARPAVCWPTTGKRPGSHEQLRQRAL